VRNRHGSAWAACTDWLAGSLWGNPIQVSPTNIHLYGCHRKTWTRVNVWFTLDWIYVIRPRQSFRRHERIHELVRSEGERCG
jgi:hypothetical protein